MARIILVDQGDPMNPAFDAGGNPVIKPQVTLRGDDAKDIIVLTRAIATQDVDLANQIRGKFGYEKLAAPGWLDKTHTNRDLLKTTGKVILAGVVVYLVYRVGKSMFSSKEEAEKAAAVTGETVEVTDAVFQAPVPAQAWMPPVPAPQARS